MAPSTPIKRTSSILVVAFAALLLAASASFAQEYPPGVAFGFACAPESPSVGDTVECGIVGAQPGEDLSVTAEYGSEIFFEAELVADDAGTAAFSFVVPAEAEGQDIIVTVVGSESGTLSLELENIGPATDTDTPPTTTPVPDDTDQDDVATPVATPVTPTDDLPRTGIESSTLLAAGAALLLLGGFTVMAARRRDRGRVDA